MNDIAHYAALLDAAACNATAVAQFDPEGRMTLPDAYAIQAASIARRLARGERRSGVKMGFTSLAKMQQMGLSDVIWGRLTTAMLVQPGGSIDFARFVRPRAEPEIAFLMKAALPGNATEQQALAAVEAIAPAIEIIDSRYQNFKFSLPEVIADNASSSAYVVGAWQAPHIDFADLPLTLNIDDKVVQRGSTAAILGSPLRSLAAAARLSAAAGEPLQPGWVVMAGGATSAEWINPGQHVFVDMEQLGRADFHVR